MALFLQDRAVLQERTKELAAERSSLRKMAMDLDRERHEIDKVKHKYEVQFSRMRKLCILFKQSLAKISFTQEEQASWTNTMKSWSPSKPNGVISSLNVSKKANRNIIRCD